MRLKTRQAIKGSFKLMGEFGTPPALPRFSLSPFLLWPPPPLCRRGGGGKEQTRGSLRMKHDVDSCNFAMDIVM